MIGEKVGGLQWSNGIAVQSERANITVWQFECSDLFLSAHKNLQLSLSRLLSPSKSSLSSALPKSKETVHFYELDTCEPVAYCGILFSGLYSVPSPNMTNLTELFQQKMDLRLLRLLFDLIVGKGKEGSESVVQWEFREIAMDCLIRLLAKKWTNLTLAERSSMFLILF